MTPPPNRIEISLDFYGDAEEYQAFLLDLKAVLDRRTISNTSIITMPVLRPE